MEDSVLSYCSLGLVTLDKTMTTTLTRFGVVNAVEMEVNV